MRAFIVISCLVVAYSAAPQGYTYNPPASGLGLSLLPPSSNSLFSAAPVTQYSGNSQSFSIGLAPISSHGSLGLDSHSNGGSLSLGSSYSVSQSTPSFGSGSLNEHSFGSANSLSHSFSGNGNSISSGSSIPINLAGVVNVPLSPVATAPVSSSFVSPAATNTLVQKHIYVHVPPPEEEEFSAPLPLSPVANRQKHYKIIFIKAPSTPSVSKQLVQAQLAQQQAEEKTLVYVLVKKPESIEELANSIPRIPISQPSKPEVYFIKYKAQSTDGLSQAIPLSVPQSLPTLAQPIGLSSDIPGVLGQGTILTSSIDSAESLSSQAAQGTAAVVTTSSSSSASSSLGASSFSADTLPSSGSTSLGLSNSNVANIAAVIQPRTPAPVYGPPK